MVMGVQRSGTTTLFNSLARDRNLTGFHESVDNAIYHRYQLRPLREVARLFNAAPGTVLLKPISETSSRTLDEIAAEYAAYDLRFVWIYRDPVNVLYSMQRMGWLPPAQIDAAVHFLDWESRNRLALRFHAQHPSKIAIIRYEDCCTDPQVFRRLCRWLGVAGTSLFRTDSGVGQKNVARAAREKINAAVGLTLLALDDARIFKSRAFFRWRHSLREALSEIHRKNGSTRAGLSTPEDSSTDHVALSSAPPRAPSEIEGLRFWMDVSACEPGADGTVTDFRERGPRRMKANCDKHRPLHMFVNGKAALFFPPEKFALRETNGSGIVRFGGGEDWSFMFDGSPVSIFAVFKPKLSRFALDPPQRAIVFRVGSRRKAAPAFFLEWNGLKNPPKGILASAQSTTEVVAATPVGDPFDQQWRINYLHYRESESGTPPDRAPAESAATGPMPPRPEPQPSSDDCDLQLGGNHQERDALFYGAVADLIIFQHALDPDEELSVIRYLKEKHQL